MRRIWMILPLALMLTGCKTIADIKPDTIVDIPLHPTQVQTEEATEITTIWTESPTETVPVTEGTEPVTTPPRVPGGNQSGQGTGNQKPNVTEPPPDVHTEPPTQPPSVPAAYDPFGYVPGSLDRAVSDEINARRQAGGLAALGLDDRLCAIASVRARELARTWSNTRPDGRPGITVLAEYGYGYSVAAENLYFGPANAQAMVDKWMSSDSRRANILMEADTIGVGSCTAADGITFVAVIFTG